MLVFWRCFSSAVVFLYLLEEETSYLILVPAGIGSVIEVSYVAILSLHNCLPVWHMIYYN